MWPGAITYDFNLPPTVTKIDLSLISCVQMSTIAFVSRGKVTTLLCAGYREIMLGEFRKRPVLTVATETE